MQFEFLLHELKFREGFELLKNNIEKIVSLNISSFVIPEVRNFLLSKQRDYEKIRAWLWMDAI